MLWSTAQIPFPGIFIHHWLLKSSLAHGHTPYQGWPTWLVDMGTKVCCLAWIWDNAEGPSSCRAACGMDKAFGTAAPQLSPPPHPSALLLSQRWVLKPALQIVCQKTKYSAKAWQAHWKYLTNSNFTI